MLITEYRLDRYVDYLNTKKHMNENTVNAYMHDVMDFISFLKSRGNDLPEEASDTDVTAYLLFLKQEDRSSSTVNRKLASIRSYYKYLVYAKVLSENPAEDVKTPKIVRKEIEYLSIDEVGTLLGQPDDSIKGKRDSAILEVLYATGVRVSELVEMNTDDINLRMGFITCNGDHGKARIIPLGRPARQALERYMYEDRSAFLNEKNKSENALFLNYYGDRLTRQALWKILKNYADAAGLSKKLTPQTLRNSFAVHMVQNGADLKSLQEMLGLEDMTATQIYLSVTKNKIKDVYDKTHPRA